MIRQASKLFLCAVALSFGVSEAQAIQITFSGNSATSGSFGNIRTFAAGGVTLNASAQSYINSAWTNSYLGIYSTGLGVTNSNEGNGGNLMHTVDNIGSTDRVVFSFSEAVVLDSIGLTAYGDTDITAYYYSGGSWLTLENNLGGTSNRTANINAGNISASIWAVGAINPANAGADSFKINTVTFAQVAPPPPQVPDTGASLLLLAIGAACMVFAKKWGVFPAGKLNSL